MMENNNEFKKLVKNKVLSMAATALRLHKMLPKKVIEDCLYGHPDLVAESRNIDLLDIRSSLERWNE